MRASKLESLGLMSGDIEHDFNNILAAIMSNLSLVRTAALGVDEIDEILEEADLACRRAKDLTRQLLTFSKGGAPVKTPASIGEIIEDVAVFALRGSNVGCRFDIPSDLKAVHVDVGQICQVINNLVLNAIQAMPKGGVLDIMAANVYREDLGNLPLSGGEYIEIRIADHGVGIPRRHLEAIFDPYFSTNQIGSGLGLATSYSIMQRHDGLIAADSEEGVGTTMTIYLPVAADSAGNPAPAATALVKGHGRVLLMDDEEQILRSTGRLLRMLGYEPVFARNGTEAIEACRRAFGTGAGFAIGIMDLTIPGGLGGQETAAILRKRHPELKMIASSGYANNPVLADHRAYGFVGILSKPYNLTELNLLLLQVQREPASAQEAPFKTAFRSLSRGRLPPCPHLRTRPGAPTNGLTIGAVRTNVAACSVREFEAEEETAGARGRARPRLERSAGRWHGVFGSVVWADR